MKYPLQGSAFHSFADMRRIGRSEAVFKEISFGARRGPAHYTALSNPGNIPRAAPGVFAKTRQAKNGG